MIDYGSLEYAHARLQARHGQRPDEAAWRRVEHVREFAPLLEAGRGTALRPWLVGITGGSSAHEVEATLRGHWRALVAEVAGWMPLPWQPALAWCAVLPDLAALQYLSRDGEPPAWMRADPRWSALVQAAPAQRESTVAAGPLAPLASAWAAPEAIGAAWRAEWRRRLPGAADVTDPAVADLVRALVDHRQAFTQAAAGQAWTLRGALRGRLVLLLRRAASTPVTAFIHLALWALELERLRAELLGRLLFPGRQVA